jgi:hypothetical protein
VVRDDRSPLAAPPRPPFTRTATLFGALRASLFEARMLPADFCNCITDVRALSTGLSFPRRDDGHDHLPFLTHHARPPLARSGDARRAAHSSDDLDPVAGSFHFRGLARPRYQSRRITSRGSACASSRELPMEGLTIDVHGSLDRVKDVSSFGAAPLKRHHEEYVRLAHVDDVPLLILPEGTCCRRCVRLPGKSP